VSSEAALSLYVLDTHALYWYWTDPARLGSAADSVFRALEAGRARALVPLIVVAELHFLSGKLGRPLPVGELLRLVDRAPSLHLEALTRRHLVAFGTLGEIPEMHDRLIGAVALVHEAPVVSRDRSLRDHPLIRVVW
jgi:PIN domain nuclease of toxin-antitoxin system